MRAAMMSWMVAGTVTSGRLKPRLAALDRDAARLLKLAENLLHVERIPLALFGEDLEQLLGDFLRGEQGPDHPADVAVAEAFEGDRLRQRRGEPGRRVARARRQHQQDAMAGQARRQMREEFLRGRVDPVHVLDDQDERRRFARAEQHVAQHVEGPLLQLGARQAVEKFRRRGHAEEVGEQDGRFLAFQAEELKLFGDTVPELLACDPLGQTEVSPQQLHDRAVRHGAAVRHARRLQLEGSGAVEPPQELVEQAGFADPRFAHEQHDARPRRRRRGGGLR